MSFINLSAIQNQALNQQPFPYIYLPNFLNETQLKPLVDSFPSIKNRGSIPLHAVHMDDLFSEFITELKGPELRNLIADKFQMDLTNKPTMITLRGHTTTRDGHIHVDSKDKLVTVLLYFNLDWHQSTGHLRLLNNKNDLDNYAMEIPAIAGHCVIFKVTPNGWHGHYPFTGKRLSLQLNYMASDLAVAKHLNQHRFSSWLKKLLPGIYAKEY
jgi:SM-20-related protein